jgi:hypothetical protein
MRIKGKNLWCWMGLHKWPYPGGDCMDCGKHDDLFDDEGRVR